MGKNKHDDDELHHQSPWVKEKLHDKEFVYVHRPPLMLKRHQRNCSRQRVPIIIVSFLVIIIFALGLYLYAQATECQMRKYLNTYCSTSGKCKPINYKN